MSVQRYHPGVTRVLSTGGDESGTIQMNGNYGVTPATFYYETPENESYRWDRANILYTDTGSMDPGAFGNGGSVSNGFNLQYLDPDGNEVCDLMGAATITINADWHLVAGVDAQPLSYGQGDEAFSVRWSFDKYSEGLYCPAGYRISVTLNDNWTFLTSFRVAVQGEVLGN